MTGEDNLSRLLAGLDPALDPLTYVFATAPHGADLSGVEPLMTFAEAEALTLILPAQEAQRHGYESVFACRRITLQIHSALHAVGMIAAVSNALARAGIATNPVSAFFHDHIFVAEQDAAMAMSVLKNISEA